MVLLFPELDVPRIRNQPREQREHLARQHTLSNLKGYRQTMHQREFDRIKQAEEEAAHMALLLAARRDRAIVNQDDLFKEAEGDDEVSLPERKGFDTSGIGEPVVFALASFTWCLCTRRRF